MVQREFKFNMGIETLKEGHSDWVIREVDSCKQLLDHTNELYIAMLTAIKFRAAVKVNAEISVGSSNQTTTGP
jgi:hypothetical protein